MNEFKYQFVNIILLALLGTGIYWAFTTIDNSVVYDKDTIVVVNSENKDTDEVEEIILFDNTKRDEEVEVITPKETESQVTLKELSKDEKELLSKLEGLISDNINMKVGSHGTRVGTVQKFLNVYFKTTKVVDNEYGPGTKSDVKKFQQSEKLGADGLAGPNTYRKMVQILKK